MLRWSRYAPDYLFDMTLDLPEQSLGERALSNCAASILPPAGVPRNTPGSLPTVECGGCYLWPDALRLFPAIGAALSRTRKRLLV